MSKQDVIDYVMNTPHNTNPAILGQKLDEMGVQSDWNQNDPTKADYVKNRTHYTEINETIYEVVIENGVFDTGTTTKEVAYAFFNNLENVTFTTEDGSIIAITDCEITNYEGYIIASLGELKLTIMVDPLWKFLASKNGTFNLTLREEVVHKIPEKYLPDSIGGGTGGASNVMIIHMNENNAENQVYPEGLYDTIDRMIQNSFFDTFIIVGDANAEYNTIVFRPIQRISKDDDGYVIKLASPSSNRILHVRPDNSGWLEYEE